MKFHLMWHFIWVFTVCQSTCSPVSRMKRVKQNLKFLILMLVFFISSQLNLTSGPEVIKLFSCSTQLSTKFQRLIKVSNGAKIRNRYNQVPHLKYRQLKKCIALNLSDVVFIMLKNVKMPTIVGILTFMSMVNFVLS